MQKSFMSISLVVIAISMLATKAQLKRLSN